MSDRSKLLHLALNVQRAHHQVQVLEVRMRAAAGADAALVDRYKKARATRHTAERKLTNFARGLPAPQPRRR